MWENMKFKSEKSYGSILAAYFVFSVGMVACSAFVFVWFEGGSRIAWWVLGGLFVFAVLSLLLRRTDLPSSSMMGIFGSHRREITDDYTPRRRRPKSLDFGTNSPPTVEDVREAADGPNNWVPSGAASGRRSVRKR